MHAGCAESASRTAGNNKRQACAGAVIPLKDSEDKTTSTAAFAVNSWKQDSLSQVSVDRERETKRKKNRERERGTKGETGAVH